MNQETRSWPYEFPLSNDFPKSVERGFVYGRLQVHDRFTRFTYSRDFHVFLGCIRRIFFS